MDPIRTYGLTVLDPPAVEPVSLAEARANSRIDTTDHDSKLTLSIEAARKWVEEQTETSLVSTQWRWTLDRFPRKRDWLMLPRWPVLSIEAIRYTDADGATQTISLPTVKLRKNNDGRGRIARVDWEAWPTTRVTPDAVEIDFTAGFGPAASDVPAIWKQPILLLVSHWFENAEASIVGTIVAEPPFGVHALIETLRDALDADDFDLE